MNPMDKDYIEQNDVVQRYRVGSLTPEEAEAFEVYLLEHPDLLEQLELDSLLANGMSRLTQPFVETKNNKPFWWGIFGALGGGAVTFAAVMFLIIPNTSNIGGTTQIVYLETVRGEPVSETVTVKAEKVVVLVLDTGTNYQTSFNAKMTSLENRVVTNWANMESDEYGQAVLLLDTEFIYSGEFQITIESSQEGMQSLTYQFSLVKKL